MAVWPCVLLGLGGGSYARHKVGHQSCPFFVLLGLTKHVPLSFWVSPNMAFLCPFGSHQTRPFFVLLGGSHTFAGTEAEPAAELVFPCAAFWYLQKSLCMLQKVWVSSPGSWALQESNSHHQGKKRCWKCRFVRTIIQVGHNSFLV